MQRETKLLEERTTRDAPSREAVSRARGRGGRGEEIRETRLDAGVGGDGAVRGGRQLQKLACDVGSLLDTGSKRRGEGCGHKWVLVQIE